MLIHIGEYKPGQRQQRTRWKLQKQKEERKEKNRQSINSQFHFFFLRKITTAYHIQSMGSRLWNDWGLLFIFPLFSGELCASFVVPTGNTLNCGIPPGRKQKHLSSLAV